MSDKNKQTRLDKLYEAGNFADARPLAKEILADTAASSAQKDAARTVMRATGIDPLAIVIFCATLGMLIFITLWYMVF